MDKISVIKQYIADNYNLGNIYNIKLMADNSNSVFLISNGFGQYIFRIYSVKKDEEVIKSEIELLSFLTYYGLNIESTISNCKGVYYDTIQLDNSIRNCAMYNVLSGITYNELLTEKRSKKLGEVIGKFHHALDLYCGQSSFRRFGYDELVLMPWQTIKPYVHHNEELYKFYKAIIKGCENKLRNNKRFLSWGLCHGDLHVGNVIFNQDNEPGIFDFDLCCKSWRVYDLATFIWSIVPREDYSIEIVEGIDKCIRSFLEGYMEQKILSTEELDLLLDIVLLRHIWRQAVRIDFEKANTEWRSEHHFVVQMNRMKKWIELYEINYKDN